MILPFVLTLTAGLSTLLGSVLVFYKVNNKIIGYSLLFAASVMISVSLLDLIPESITFFNKSFSKNISFIYVILYLILGIILAAFINKITLRKKYDNLYRVGIISLLAIILHNIPEGIITFLSSSQNIKLGIDLTIAIALHNVPEGISISIPIYGSTKNKKTALLYTLLSGIAEPVGAVIAFLFLKNYINNILMGIILSITAGIMIYIGVFELIPTSMKYKNKKNIFFFIVGVIIVIINHFII